MVITTHRASGRTLQPQVWASRDHSLPSHLQLSIIKSMLQLKPFYTRLPPFVW